MKFKNLKIFKDLIEKNEISPELLKAEATKWDDGKGFWRRIKDDRWNTKDFENLNKEEIKNSRKFRGPEFKHWRRAWQRNWVVQTNGNWAKIIWIKEKTQEISKQESLTNNKNIDQNSLEKQNDIKKEFDELKKTLMKCKIKWLFRKS